MFRTYDCIVHQHQPWLLALAVVICLAAAMTTMRTFSHARERSGRRRFAWLGAAGLAGGAGVWATHFISMLAFDPGLPTGYEAVGTLLSLLLAMAGVTAALVAAAGLTRILAAPLGGLMLGTSIGAMHATGMHAFRAAGELTWRLDYVAMAGTLGVLFSVLALGVALSARKPLARDIAAAGLFVVAIVCLHFISMAAVTITPDAALHTPSSVMPRGVMALAVGGLAGPIMLAALATLGLEAWNQRRSRRRLRGIIEAMPDGLAYFDADDRFQLWNRHYEAALAAFGLRPVLGLTYAECVVTPAAQSGAFTGSAEPGWAEARLAQRFSGSYSREQPSPDGKWYRVLESDTDDGGRVVSVVDITALKQAAEDLALARDAAQAANRAKSAFLANMSHEIRTPLNGVLGVADALALSGLNEAQAELVEIIQGSGATLNRLLCDILDLARVESGALEVIREPFALGDAVRDVGQLLAPHAGEKGVAFHLRIDPAAEGWVMGDVTRLKQVITNLAANAVKFTAQGRVDLNLERVGDTEFRIVVSDTGPGIDAEARERLFGRFQQGDGSITRRYGGSGLGLAITRELVSLMGGTMDVHSVEGRGSTFTVTVPLPHAAAPAKAASEEAASEPAERPMRVLVADDHPNNRRLLEVLLTHLGAEVVMVENGEMAVSAWRDSDFDVILMDMQMPVLDGLTATRRIRELEAGQAPRGPRTPILMISANAMPEHLAASRDAGADAHLSKPLSAERLFAALGGLEAARDEAAAA